MLNQRLKVPPSLNRFAKALDRNTAQTLFSVLLKYRPEDKAAKKVWPAVQLHQGPVYSHNTARVAACYGMPEASKPFIRSHLSSASHKLYAKLRMLPSAAVHMP